MLVIQRRQNFQELVDVKMLAGFGALAVQWLKECAFGDENLGVADFGALENSAGGGVAKIRDQRHFGAVLDFNLLLAKGGQFLAGSAHVFGFELFADADERIAQTAAAVVGCQGSDLKISADIVIVVGVHRYKFIGRALSFEVTPAAEHGVGGAGQLSWQKYYAGLHALEIALRKVIGQPGDMIHVAVGYAEVVAGE